jgi:hypothetical protein
LRIPLPAVFADLAARPQHFPLPRYGKVWFRSLVKIPRCRERFAQAFPVKDTIDAHAFKQ